MGIPTLWEVLRTSFDERVSIDEFSAEYLRQHRRPVRLAIDAYMFIFKSTVNLAANPLDDESTHPWIVLNFLSKVMYLVSLNISFVVVFDGCWKPSKLRHSTTSDAIEVNDYDADLAVFLRLRPHQYDEASPLIEAIKSRLDELDIDYTQAPGEAEAQCAYLQKFGIVDYVLSDDVDTLVFGASGVLRNFSRYKEDVGTSPKKSDPGASVTSRFYVTPVRMERVEQETGLTTPRLVFLASLGGGDYSKGVERIGVTNATKLALCGTSHAAFYHRKLLKKELKKSPNQNRAPLPDFSEQLIRCFTNVPAHKSISGWDLILPSSTRKIELAKFLDTLNSSIKSNSREIFGRLVTLSQGLVVDEYFPLLYLFPFVDSLPYKFRICFSFGEMVPVENDLNVDKLVRSNDKALLNFPRVYGNAKVLGALEVTYDGQIPTQKFVAAGDYATDSSSLYIPPKFNHRVKSIIAKLLSHRDTKSPLKTMVLLTRSKLINDIEHVMVKYDVEQIEQIYPEIYEARNKHRNNEATTDTTDDPDPLTSSPSKYRQNYIWLPRELVSMLNPSMLHEFEEMVASSPSKRPKKVLQKTTLDSMGSFSLSPVKRDLVSPSKRSVTSSPTRRISPRKRLGNPLPGQKNITLFFSKESVPKPLFEPDSGTTKTASRVDQENPFVEKDSPLAREDKDAQLSSFSARKRRQDSLFVASDEDDEPNNFSAMKTSFATIPNLEKGSNQKRSICTETSSPKKARSSTSMLVAGAPTNKARSSTIHVDKPSSVPAHVNPEYIYVESDQSMDGSIMEVGPVERATDEPILVDSDEE
ncbi:PIN domain-like protein [Suhomyces tanzawaensis NRRL Y-17324]|uniref:PIN domain-like protein n=1 Tax=Suhomyces tanzawaensis NRRL Y-17324 TaxID=984487 RepID=A0A1E4SCF4_9ASCO|nr:PIN domain-like protein [Suhomyces tanzawaensis NRRL Y-17324]ODV77201.1 PIN domain-like protein [Suhomyces tanzawaensis NRRL Y-17324]